MAAAWPANKTAVFLVDEAHTIDVWFCSPKMVAAIQTVAPGTKVLLAGDNAWSNATESQTAFAPGGPLEKADFLFPNGLARLVTSTPDTLARAQQDGRRVGYYNADSGEDPFALGMIATAPAIRARLMLRTATWKLKAEASYVSIQVKVTTSWTRSPAPTLAGVCLSIYALATPLKATSLLKRYSSATATPAH